MQTASNQTAMPLNMDMVDELGDTMKQLLLPADHELMAHDQIRALVSHVENWAENYHRGLEAGAEISMEEIEMLKKTRAELAMILSERLTLENEGGQPASKQQEERMHHVASAIGRIDQVLPQAENCAAAAVEPMRKRA
jgi:hypothetical protein